ncbi:MAG: FecR domain-containing protein [Deltaproteobacteria bacterium]|nr:FecR domain-containing protein [Deltaproteobacteria bacterium]
MRACLVTLSLLALACGGQPSSTKPKKSETPKPAPITGPSVGTLERVLSVGIAGLGGVEHITADGVWQPLAVASALGKGSRLRTKKGVRAALKLDDGSEVTLDAESQLELGGTRALTLAMGALLAVVEPNGDKPLVLQTPAGAIKVTGTRFQARVEGSSTVVDVISGSVEVGGEGKKLEIAAGERAVLKTGEAPRRERAGDLVSLTSWAQEVARVVRNAKSLEPGVGSLTARAPGRAGTRPLKLARQQVRVVIRDNIARTEIEQEFANPTSQTLEGTYRFPLPDGASISRLALYVGDRLEEGEMVERHRARRIFNAIVNDTIRARDPALLEWEGGRTFRMKIFPIPARGSRRVILAYTQVLEGRHGRLQYVYPMSTRGGRATKVGRFELSLEASGSRGAQRVDVPLYPVLREKTSDGARLRYEATDFVPAASFVAHIVPTEADDQQTAVSSARQQSAELTLALHGAPKEVCKRKVGQGECSDRGQFFMARLRPNLPVSGRPQLKNTLFVLDRSFSTGKEAWELQRAAVAAFLHDMDSRSRFAVLACGTRCEQITEGFMAPSAPARQKIKEQLEALKAEGSSNLQAAFEDAAVLVGSSKEPVHVIYMGDGRATAGEMREPELASQVVGSLAPKEATLSVLRIGEDSAALFLREATRRLGGEVVPLQLGDDLRRVVFELVAAQLQPTLSDVEVTFEDLQDNVHDVYPRTFSVLRAGGEAVIVGRYQGAGEGTLRVRGQLDGKPFERSYKLELPAEATKSANQFIPRVWAREHIEDLTLAGYDKSRPEIVNVSKSYTVLSRATALLVLENERMYKEFGVKRKRQRNNWRGDALSTKSLGEKSKGAEQESAAEEGREKQAQEEPGKIGNAADDADESVDTLSGRSGSGAAGGGSFKDDSAGPKAKARPRASRMSLAAPAVAGARRASAAHKPMAGQKSITRSAPRKKARKSKKMMPRAKGMSAMDKTLDGYGRGGRHRTVRRVKEARIRPGSTSVTAAAQRREDAAARASERDPKSRKAHSAYHRALMKNGRYQPALRHAEGWTAKDTRHPSALFALADAQTALGLASAMESYSSVVDVRPWSTRLHLRLVQMYHNKGDQRSSCAHRWSLMSLYPKRLNYHIDLAQCLSNIPGKRVQAMKILANAAKTAAGRRQARKLGLALRALERGSKKRRPRARGEIVIEATWNQNVDLDVALVTPLGERITALRSSRRGGTISDSHDGSKAEQLVLRWAHNGVYRVEIAPGPGAKLSGPVRGTLKIKARGKTKTIAFELPAPGVLQLASLRLRTVSRVYHGYY